MTDVGFRSNERLAVLLYDQIFELKLESKCYIQGRCKYLATLEKYSFVPLKGNEQAGSVKSTQVSIGW